MSTLLLESTNNDDLEMMLSQDITELSDDDLSDLGTEEIRLLCNHFGIDIGRNTRRRHMIAEIIKIRDDRHHQFALSQTEATVEQKYQQSDVDHRLQSTLRQLYVAYYTKSIPPKKSRYLRTLSHVTNQNNALPSYVTRLPARRPELERMIWLLMVILDLRHINARISGKTLRYLFGILFKITRRNDMGIVYTEQLEKRSTSGALRTTINNLCHVSEF